MLAQLHIFYFVFFTVWFFVLVITINILLSNSSLMYLTSCAKGYTDWCQHVNSLPLIFHLDLCLNNLALSS
uniref:Putative ovule protein n=1 Tax=Solanum chacoense TaxID=4108 RepID=A0A0V0GI00_SOLCH